MLIGNIEVYSQNQLWSQDSGKKKDDQKDPFHWCVSWLSLSLLLVHLGDCIWSSYLFIFADILTSEKYQKHTLPSYTRISVCLHSFKWTQLFNRNSYIFALLRELLWKFKDFFLLTFFDEILIICLRRSIVSKFVYRTKAITPTINIETIWYLGKIEIVTYCVWIVCLRRRRRRRQCKNVLAVVAYAATLPLSHCLSHGLSFHSYLFRTPFTHTAITHQLISIFSNL